MYQLECARVDFSPSISIIGGMRESTISLLTGSLLLGCAAVMALQIADVSSAIIPTVLLLACAAGCFRVAMKSS